MLNHRRFKMGMLRFQSQDKTNKAALQTLRQTRTHMGSLMHHSESQRQI